MPDQVGHDDNWLSGGAKEEACQTRVRPRSRKRVGMLAQQTTGVAAGDGLTYFLRSTERQQTQKNTCTSFEIQVSKNRSYLLSQLVGQYHRRW